MKCLEENELCQGEVELRPSLSGTGTAIARCDFHWDKRLEQQEEINRKYAPNSSVPPEDFDPEYAGERWDDDY